MAARGATVRKAAPPAATRRQSPRTKAAGAKHKASGKPAGRNKVGKSTAGRSTARGKKAAAGSAGPRAAAAKQFARTIDRRLAKAYPDARCSLDHSSPFELLVATILSAQCTDERVNMVTPALFRRFPTPEHFAAATTEEIEEHVRSTGFFRNKTRSIKGAATLIAERFGGRVPDTMEEILTLPGVARKTANVVLGTAYGQASGVVVDTHVQRVSRRLGLTSERDPAKIERDLMALLPPAVWVGFSHRVIQHGRRVCAARRPRCSECSLSDLCPSAEL
jgi:endonuclease-3